MITVYLTGYVLGKEHLRAEELTMPQVPAVDEIVHYLDRAWRITSVSWAEGDATYGTPGQWHAEIAGRA